jgi:hypothetical protein
LLGATLLAKTETSQKLQPITDMISITKWPVLVGEIPESGVEERKSTGREHI